MNIGDKLQLILSVLTLLGIIFAVYKYFREPDEQNSNDITLMKQACVFKHNIIDNSIGEIKENITLIKENHLRHIEESIRKSEKTQERILTILEERYQIKINT